MLKVINAEIKLTLPILKHNVPIMMAETISPLVKTVADDSKTEKTYSCSRTKTTYLMEQ